MSMLKWLFLDSDPSTSICNRYRLLDEIEGDGGGGISEGEVIAQQIEQGQQQIDNPPDQQRVAHEQRRGRQDFIPKHRFDEVNRPFQAYKTLGTVDDIKSKLARLQELESKPETYYTEERKRQVREDLLRVFPELQTLSATHQANNATFVAKGVRDTDEFLKQIGVEVNPANNHAFQDLIGGVISRDPNLASRFAARDATVFQDAIKIVRGFVGAKRNVPGLDVSRGKAPARASAPAQTNGKAKVEPKEIKPGPLFEREVLDQAGEAAFARLSEFEE